MRTYLYAIPLIAAFAALIYLIVREILRVWLDHKVKVMLLERLEGHPEVLHSFQELQELLDGTPSREKRGKNPDLLLTGVFLALIGIVAVVAYAMVGRSQWAVGAYFGGVACVVIGFILTTFGLLTRYLNRPPDRPR